MKSVNIKDILILLLSACLTAMAVNMFFTEYVLTPGGITGLSIAISLISGISVDLISLSISIPLLVIATYVLGSKFGIKTLFINLMIPLFLKIIPSIHCTDSIIIAAILGGILVGASISLALYSKCATGGTDVMALLIRKLIPNVKLSTILFVLDMIIVVLSMLISKNIMTSVYSILALLTIMFTIRLGGRILKYE